MTPSKHSSNTEGPSHAVWRIRVPSFRRSSSSRPVSEEAFWPTSVMERKKKKREEGAEGTRRLPALVRSASSASSRTTSPATPPDNVRSTLTLSSTMRPGAEAGASVSPSTTYTHHDPYGSPSYHPHAYYDHFKALSEPESHSLTSPLATELHLHPRRVNKLRKPKPPPPSAFANSRLSLNFPSNNSPVLADPPARPAVSRSLNGSLSAPTTVRVRSQASYSTHSPAGSVEEFGGTTTVRSGVPLRTGAEAHIQDRFGGVTATPARPTHSIHESDFVDAGHVSASHNYVVHGGNIENEESIMPRRRLSIDLGLDFSLSSSQAAWVSAVTPAAPPTRQQQPPGVKLAQQVDHRAVDVERTPSSSRTASTDEMPNAFASSSRSHISNRPLPTPPIQPSGMTSQPRRHTHSYSYSHPHSQSQSHTPSPQLVPILAAPGSPPYVPRVARSEDGHGNYFRSSHNGRSTSVTFLPATYHERKKSQRSLLALSSVSMDSSVSSPTSPGSSTTTLTTPPSFSSLSLNGGDRTRKLTKRKFSLAQGTRGPYRESQLPAAVSAPLLPAFPGQNTTIRRSSDSAATSQLRPRLSARQTSDARDERMSALLRAAGLDTPPLPAPRPKAMSEDGHSSMHYFSQKALPSPNARASAESPPSSSDLDSPTASPPRLPDRTSLALNYVTRDAGSSTAIAARVSTMLSDPHWTIGEEGTGSPEDAFNPYSVVCDEQPLWSSPPVPPVPPKSPMRNAMRRWTVAMADTRYDEAVLAEFDDLRARARESARLDVGYGAVVEEELPDRGRRRTRESEVQWKPGVRAESVVYGGPGITVHSSIYRAATSSGHTDEAEGRVRTSSDSGIELLSSAAHTNSSDGAMADDEEWQRAKRALLACRELVRTETQYLAQITRLMQGGTETPPPPLMRRYLPALVRASEALLSALSADPSAWGAASAFVAQADTLERAFVPWCGVVGDWFVSRRAVLTKRPSRRRESVSPSPPLRLSMTFVRRARSRSKSRDPDSVGRWRGSGARAMPSLPTSPVVGPRPQLEDVPTLNLNEDTHNTGAPPAKEARPPAVHDLAIQPTQRVMRYVLQYRDLLKHIPPSSPARELVERAVSVAAALAEKCDRAQGNARFLRRGT